MLIFFMLVSMETMIDIVIGRTRPSYCLFKCYGVSTLVVATPEGNIIIVQRPQIYHIEYIHVCIV